MNILHLVHQYMPEFVGGTELYTQELATRQAAAGHAVAIVVPSGEFEEAEPYNENGVSVYRIFVGQRSATQVFLDPLVGRRSFSDRWVEILDAFRPDLVHVQHVMGVPLDAVRMLVERKIPYIVTLHDYFYACANGQLYTNTDQQICAGPNSVFSNCGRCVLARGNAPSVPPLGLLTAPLPAYRFRQTRIVLEQATTVIAPTRFVKNTYVSLGFSADQIQVIPHGIEFPDPAEIPSFTPPDRLSLVYIGGISPQKGLHILIEAVQEIPELSLRIYGDLTKFPDYVQTLKRLITASNTHLMGRVAHAEIWSILGHADALMMPTLWYESSPLIVDEAFVAGTPIIASALGAAPERIRDGETGFLLPAGDIPAWRTHLKALSQRPERLRALRPNIRPLWSLDRHVEAIERVVRLSAGHESL